jgi:hypothetical protein
MSDWKKTSDSHDLDKLEERKPHLPANGSEDIKTWTNRGDT